MQAVMRSGHVTMKLSHLRQEMTDVMETHPTLQAAILRDRALICSDAAFRQHLKEHRTATDADFLKAYLESHRKGRALHRGPQNLDLWHQ